MSHCEQDHASTRGELLAVAVTRLELPQCGQVSAVVVYGVLMALPSFRTVDPGRERLGRVSLEDCDETAPLPGLGEGLMPRRVLSRED